jgi:hypothetical protein
MNKLIEELMLLVNDSIKDNTHLDLDILRERVNNSDCSLSEKSTLLEVINTPSDLTNLNKKLFNIGYEDERKAKHIKTMKKFRNNEDNKTLVEDFFKYENYVYSLISTKTYKSKMSKTKSKVELLDIHNTFGHDAAEAHKDLIQEGKLYLWEGLKKFGVLPEKDKKFGGQTRERKVAGKSTFVHENLKNNLINLGIKSSSDKFRATLLEFKNEILEGPNNED